MDNMTRPYPSGNRQERTTAPGIARHHCHKTHPANPPTHCVYQDTIQRNHTHAAKTMNSQCRINPLSAQGGVRVADTTVCKIV